MTVFKIKYQYLPQWIRKGFERDEEKFVACVTDDALDAVKFVKEGILKEAVSFRLTSVVKVCELDFALDALNDIMFSKISRYKP